MIRKDEYDSHDKYRDGKIIYAEEGNTVMPEQHIGLSYFNKHSMVTICKIPFKLLEKENIIVIDKETMAVLDAFADEYTYGEGKKIMMETHFTFDEFKATLK